MSDVETLFALPGENPQDETEDQGLRDVVRWFRTQSDIEARFGSALRQALDEVLDGQRTGRFDIDLASKTEKTYLGTKVEIVVKATFELAAGTRMDYKIAGNDVDAKFSMSGTWSIPTEAMGHLCLLMAANDRRGTFDVGLVRIRPELLNKGENKDSKKTINKDGRASIVWLARNATLPRNLLLSLPTSTTERIMNKRSGQQRINELLRNVQGSLIDRNTAVTVARQEDGLKRCRDARKLLRAEGIAVLGHQNDSPRVAASLGLPVPTKGTFVSTRLVEVAPETTDRATAYIAGRHYAVAGHDDPIQPTPEIRY